MPKWPVICFFFLFTACATRGEKLSQKYSHLPVRKLIEVPFIVQAKFHCGPASLNMVASHLDQKFSGDITSTIYTPGPQGTFQNDLISATRRLGLIAVPVRGIKNLLIEVAENNPILVFQNLGLSWLPRWHYAVVTGFDLSRNKIILHSGEIKNYVLSIPTFEKTWRRTENWGLIIVKPGSITKTMHESEIAIATAGLELAGYRDEAKKSYEKILEIWPGSFGALVGLGNIYYHKNDFKNSIRHLHAATTNHPNVSSGWYNYALALYADDNRAEARKAAKKAIEFAEIENIEDFKKNLRPLLE